MTPIIGILLVSWLLLTPEGVTGQDILKCSSCGALVMTPDAQFSIYFLSYNVDKRKAKGSKLESLLELGNGGARYDLYVVTIQEDKGFNKMVTDALVKHDYVKVAGHKKKWTFLAIYAPKTDATNYQDCSVHSVELDSKVKLSKVRKAVVGIRCGYLGVSFAFVGAHFSAFAHANQRRIEEYHAVMKAFARFDLLGHDFVFFVGDLNFRLNLTMAEARDGVKQKAWDRLLLADQLNQVRQNGLAFAEFVEPPIAFQPTYKVDMKKLAFDTKDPWHDPPYAPWYEERRPAYPDRFLYRNTLARRVKGVDPSVRNMARLKVVRYEAVTDALGSDHLPVRAVVNIPAEVWQLRPYRPLDGVAPGGRKLG